MSRSSDDAQQKSKTEDSVVEKTTFCNGVVLGCKKLNVRVKPNKNAEILRTIPAGTKVEIDETQSTKAFYRVYSAADESHSWEGYCMKKYIKIEKQRG